LSGSILLSNKNPPFLGTWKIAATAGRIIVNPASKVYTSIFPITKIPSATGWGRTLLTKDYERNKDWQGVSFAISSTGH